MITTCLDYVHRNIHIGNTCLSDSHSMTITVQVVEKVLSKLKQTLYDLLSVQITKD